MKTGRPKGDNSKQKKLTIRLPDDLYLALVKYATEHELTKTDVALRSLEEYLSKRK